MNQELPSFITNRRYQINKTYHFKNACLDEIHNSRYMIYLPMIQEALRFFDRHPEINYENLANNLEHTTFLNRLQDIDEDTKLPFLTEVNFETGEILLKKRIRELMPTPLLFFNLLHEYNHIATIRTKENGEGCIGFYQQVGNNTIGQGLNEGCTQFFVYKDLRLDNYYLPVVDPKTGKTIRNMIAPMETSVAALLSHIIGEKKLRKMYYEGDLNGVIQILSSYRQPEEVLKWIDDLDKLSINNRIDDQSRQGISSYSLKKYFGCVHFLEGIFLEKYPSRLFDSGKRTAFKDDKTSSFAAFYVPKDKNKSKVKTLQKKMY